MYVFQYGVVCACMRVYMSLSLSLSLCVCVCLLHVSYASYSPPTSVVGSVVYSATKYREQQAPSTAKQSSTPAV